MELRKKFIKLKLLFLLPILIILMYNCDSSNDNENQPEHDEKLEYLRSIVDKLQMIWRNSNGEIIRIDSNCLSDDQSYPEGNEFCYSPADDICPGYRGVTGYEISPACYATKEECIAAGYENGIHIPDLRNVANSKY